MMQEPIRCQQVLAELGHVATRAQLAEQLSAREIAAAVSRGHIVRLGHGRYGLRSATAAQKVAMRLSGTASHLSAAQLHRWPILRAPTKPWVTVPRKRNVAESVRAEVNVVFGEVNGIVTDPVRTVIDCAKRLPFGEALSVADSALRAGDVDKANLVVAAADLRGPGSARCRRVVEHASDLAGSCFESGLHAIGIEVGLDLTRQHPIQLPGRLIHPDLVDVRRKLVLEADSYRHHLQDYRVFQQDLWRYTALTVAGWTVLRFGFEHVVAEADWTADCLRTFI